MKPGFAAIGLLLPVLLFVVITASVGSGAACFEKYGYIRPSKSATADFENYRIRPDDNYYYSGPEYIPNAIIGIDKKYILETQLWKKLDLTPKKLRDLVHEMRLKGLDTGHMLHGFDIVDQYGNVVGIWYSVLGVSTVVRTEEGNRLILYTPPLNVYEQELPTFRRMFR
ncbi:MAG: hypothetical protein ACE14T_11360 [Syntrophales bacterium]